MKCVIPGVNLKVFGRAIHSLAKIGDELYFEPLEQGLSLRTVNSSRSAYACFMFFPSYFQHYDDGLKELEANEDSEEEGLRCKITMKSVMAVFRSLSSIEKTVEKCKITHNAKEARIVFELHCRHGIVKTHNLAYIECETLQAVFSKDMCPNKLTAPPKLLCEVVVNFQTTQEEVTLSVRPDRVSLRNYVEDEPDPNKVVHTELSLAPDEFNQYQVGVDTDITFCLKELRAILAFGETTGLPLNINFESAGRPVTFCIDSDQTFEANFVLATLADVDMSASQQSQSQRPSTAVSQSHRKPASGSQHQPKRVNENGTLKPKSASLRESSSSKVSAGNDRPDSKRNGYTPPQPQTTADDFEDESMANISVEELAAAMEAERDFDTMETGQRSRVNTETGQGQGSRSAGVQHRLENESETSDNKNEKDNRSNTLNERVNSSQSRHANKGQGSHTDQSSHNRGQSSQEDKGESSGRKEKGGGEKRRGDDEDRGGGDDEGESGGVSSPVIPVLCTSGISPQQKRGVSCLQPLEEEDEELDETIPGTPPAKKFRSLFFGSSQKGQTSQRANAQVLAADTDEEDD